MPGGPEVSGPDRADPAAGPARSPWRDAALWSFIAAMVLFHAANAPGGVYLGLFLSSDLHAAPHRLAEAFVVSMVAWMIVVRPAGTLADRWGRRPLLIAAWAIMAVRLAIVAVARTSGEVVANQALDGLSNGLFAVLAAAWVTDRLGGAAAPARPRRSWARRWSSARHWGLISRPSASRRWATAGSSACWRASARPRRCWCSSPSPNRSPAPAMRRPEQAGGRLPELAPTSLSPGESAGA